MLRAEDVCQTMTAAFPSTHSSLLGILVSIKGKNRLYIQISYCIEKKLSFLKLPVCTSIEH